MKQLTTINTLRTWDKAGQFVFTKHDLRKLFRSCKDKAFDIGLSRLVNYGILKRACRGVYVIPEAESFDGYTIEHIAIALRPGHYNYVSLESILSEYGVISQIMIDRITIMTTGRRGTYHTPYGTIEFTHTKRSVIDILNNTLVHPRRPLRIARKSAAVRDLRRVGRNTEMIDEEELDDE